MMNINKINNKKRNPNFQFKNIYQRKPKMIIIKKKKRKRKKMTTTKFHLAFII